MMRCFINIAYPQALEAPTFKTTYNFDFCLYNLYIL